ncbi:unnamed protein product [Effrenium voratum]|nr:unnamed protein product [Effrenium voratum]
MHLTENYTFAEMDFVVRRTFLRSTNEEGGRDPVALHHFEKILAETPAQSLQAYQGSRSLAPGAQPEAASDPGKPDKKKKTSKDPMESIFGWCNFWLPAAFHLPPVVWAMVIFGLMAHLMARSTCPADAPSCLSLCQRIGCNRYQPYSKRKNRHCPRAAFLHRKGPRKEREGGSL